MNSSLLGHNTYNFKSTGSNIFPKMLGGCLKKKKSQIENIMSLRTFNEETKSQCF